MSSDLNSNQLTPQSAKHALSKIRTLNDVFEFAKNDENSKYLADSITRNFSSKRIKLKKLMDEVVVLQKESNYLDLKNQSQVDSKLFANKKKTLVSILSSPSNTKHKSFNLPLFNKPNSILDSTQAKQININNNTNNIYLRDIFELIKLNNQSIETTNNSNNKLFLEYNKPDESIEDTNDLFKRKSFINKLDEKEQVLSNNINRNMEFLQSCLKANLLYNKNQDMSKKYPLRVIKLTSAPITTTTSSLLSTLKDDLSHDDETQIKKKLNFYSIGNFKTLSNLKEPYEDNKSIGNSEINDCIVLNEENESNIRNETDTSVSMGDQVEIKDNFTCSFCGLKVKKLNMLKLHMKSHDNLKSYTCSWCNITFKTKGNLAKHLKTQGHFRKCLELGMNANDTKITSNNMESYE